ncbi:hypothetical protein V8D89_005588 [Ganoderma adspersum]
MDSHWTGAGRVHFVSIPIPSLLLTPDSLTLSAFLYLRIHLQWNRNLNLSSPAAGKSPYFGNYRPPPIVPINSVHDVGVTFQCEAHGHEGGGESIIVTLLRRDPCCQCGQWITGMFYLLAAPSRPFNEVPCPSALAPVLQGSLLVCHDELRRRQREISHLRDIMQSSSKVTTMIKEMYEDAEANRKKAENELVRWKLDCQCDCYGW